MKQLFLRKPVGTLGAHEGGLHRVLDAFNLTTLGIGGIIGAGIFVLTGQAAAEYAGPAIVLSFVLSGGAAALAGLCYAEFAAMIPIAGSAYTYAYSALGELLAWIIGWDLVLEYLFGAASVAVGWSGYVTSFLKDWGIFIPPSLTAATGTELIKLPDMGWVQASQGLVAELAQKGVLVDALPHATALMNLPAMLIILVMSSLLVVGIKESANFNNIIVVLKVAVILLFIGFGISYIKMENLTPFLPSNTGEFGHFGWSGIARGAGVVFFAYIGFDAVSTAALEAKNPQRDMPVGILGSLAICSVLYILVAVVMTGMVSYTHLAVADPIAVAVDAAGPGLFWLRPLIKMGAIAGLSSVVLVMLMGQARIFFSMAQDGLLPSVLAKIHPRFRTPWVPTVMICFVAMALAGLFPIGILGEMVSIGTLLAFAIVSLGVLVLRKTDPDLPRSFRTPWMPWVPILGVVTSLFEMVFLPLATWIRLLVWLALGMGMYFAYGVRHSRLRKSALK
ncbi:amino acid permease [Bdellovibrionota bacterium FG-2]